MKTEAKEWILKYVSIGTIVIIWIIFFWWRHGHPESDLGVPIGIGTILTVVSLLFAFGGKIKNLLPKKLDSMPKSLTEEKITEIIEIEAEKKWNNIKIDNPYEWKKTKTVNQNIIVARKVNLNLDDDQFIIILNATYPNIEPSVYPAMRKDGKGNMISVDKDDYYIDKIMNDKSINPHSEPDVIRTKEGLDPFKNPVRETEQIIHKEKEKEEKPVA